MYMQDFDEIVSKFVRFYAPIMACEGLPHGYSIIDEEMTFCCVHCVESHKRETSRKSADREQQ